MAWSSFNSIIVILISLCCIESVHGGSNSPSLNFTVCETGCPYARLNAYGALSSSLIKLQYSANGAATGNRGTWTIKGTLNSMELAPIDVLAIATSSGFALGVTQRNGTVLDGVVYRGVQCMVRNKRTIECTTPQNRVTFTEIGPIKKTFANRQYSMQATIRSDSLKLPAQDQTPLRVMLGLSDVLYVDRSSMPCTLKGQTTVTMTCCA